MIFLVRLSATFAAATIASYAVWSGGLLHFAIFGCIAVLVFIIGMLAARDFELHRRPE